MLPARLAGIEPHSRSLTLLYHRRAVARRVRPAYLHGRRAPASRDLKGTVRADGGASLRTRRCGHRNRIRDPRVLLAPRERRCRVRSRRWHLRRARRHAAAPRPADAPREVRGRTARSIDLNHRHGVRAERSDEELFHRDFEVEVRPPPPFELSAESEQGQTRNGHRPQGN